jgi:hypothetical protein
MKGPNQFGKAALFKEIKQLLENEVTKLAAAHIEGADYTYEAMVEQMRGVKDEGDLDLIEKHEAYFRVLEDDLQHTGKLK